MAYKSDDKHKFYGSGNQAGIERKPPVVKKTKQFKRPNVLVIGIETLRADHVGCLGYHRNTTPTLDRLAKEGAVFSDTIATSSWTVPTVMSVFTSLYPSVHKATTYDSKLPDSRVTLAELLKKNGYMTAAFTGNPTLDGRLGFAKGFDLYDDFSVNLDVGLDLFENTGMAGQELHNTATNHTVNRAAISWLRKNHTTPFFMFVFYFDPHFDYVPPSPFDTVFDPNYAGSIDGRGINLDPRKSTRPPKKDLDHIIALYDGEILYTDSCISQFLEKFAELGILDDTLIVVFGDHGDEFYEHGSTSHAHSLYNELIHIPLILRWPAAISKNTKITALVSQVDIMPTILDYMSIDYGGPMQGASLKPLIEGRKEKLHDVVCAEVSLFEDKLFSAAITKNNKFILNRSTKNKQLFDLNSDTTEQINIYKTQLSGKPIALEKHLNSWMSDNSRIAAQLGANNDLQNVKPDDCRLDQLRSLGYVQ